jgi:hypothetical protein
MKTTKVCEHIVGSTDTSLGDVYGAGLRPVIDNKTFEETGRYRHFHGYRACLSCGEVFGMGIDITDADGRVLERNGFDTSQIPIPSQWKTDGIGYWTVIYELADEEFSLLLAIDDTGIEPILEWMGNSQHLYLGYFNIPTQIQETFLAVSEKDARSYLSRYHPDWKVARLWDTGEKGHPMLAGTLWIAELV